MSARTALRPRCLPAADVCAAGPAGVVHRTQLDASGRLSPLVHCGRHVAGLAVAGDVPTTASCRICWPRTGAR